MLLPAHREGSKVYIYRVAIEQAQCMCVCKEVSLQGLKRAHQPKRQNSSEPMERKLDVKKAMPAARSKLFVRPTR